MLHVSSTCCSPTGDPGELRHDKGSCHHSSNSQVCPHQMVGSFPNHPGEFLHSLTFLFVEGAMNLYVYHTSMWYKALKLFTKESKDIFREVRWCLCSNFFHTKGAKKILMKKAQTERDMSEELVLEKNGWLNSSSQQSGKVPSQGFCNLLRYQLSADFKKKLIYFFPFLQQLNQL